MPSDNIDEAAGTSTRRNDRTLIEDQNNSTSFIVKFLIPKEMPGERRQYAAEYNNIETLVLKCIQLLYDMLITCLF